MTVTYNGITYDHDQADWGSSRIYDDMTLDGLWAPDKVIVHWGGATIPPTTRFGERRILQGWQRYHLSRGWQDLAYGAGVGNSGDAYRIRGWNHSGAQSGDYEGDGIPENSEAFAIVWIGGAGGPISDAAYETMGRLVREAQASIDLDVPVTIGHRDVKGKDAQGRWSTSCPGDEWWTWVHENGWIVPPGADQEDDMVWRTSLQRQSPEYFVGMQGTTGSPVGADPGYWGKSHDAHGNRIRKHPDDTEWTNALPELAAASLEYGGLHPEAEPGPKGDPGNDGDDGEDGKDGLTPVSGTLIDLQYK